MIRSAVEGKSPTSKAVVGSQSSETDQLASARQPSESALEAVSLCCLASQGASTTGRFHEGMFIPSAAGVEQEIYPLSCVWLTVRAHWGWWQANKKVAGSCYFGAARFTFV